MSACIAVTLTALRLRLQGFNALAAPYLNRTPGPVADQRQAGLVLRWVDFQATRRLPWSTCLTRSLAYCRECGSHDCAPALRLGVVREAPFQAHAWVEFANLELEPSAEARTLSLVRE